VRQIARSVGAVFIRANKPAQAKKLSDLTQGLGKVSSAQQINQAAEAMNTVIKAEFP
jgi:hypothetical protein